MVYRPTVPPAGLDADGLRKWTEDEFRQMSQGLGDFDLLQLNKISAPAGPTPGMLAYADGVTWNPGSGTGFYGRTGAGAWKRFLIDTDIPASVSSVGSGAGVIASPNPIVGAGTLALDPAYLRGYIAGLILSTAGASATFSVSAGIANNSTNAALMILANAISKTTAAWAVGTATGGLDAGAIAANTWYKVYLIRRPDTGVVDVAITVNLLATGPTFGGNIPAAYTQFRYIGSMKTNGASQWTAFLQLGDEFVWLVPPTDVNTAVLGAVATLFALSVPLGVQVVATVRGGWLNAAISAGLLTSPDETAAAVNAGTGFMNVLNSVAGIYGTIENIRLRTNISSQIRAVSNAANTTLQLATTEWTDTRGRLL